MNLTMRRPLITISSMRHFRKLVDLHVYLVPLDCWLSYQKLARNHVMDESISLGFIRVQSQLTLHDLRKELEIQLERELLPRIFVFLKSVGRNFTQVKSRQEFQLKVRDFVPPYALEPELYILQSPPLCPWERLAFSKSGIGMTKPMSSSSANRYSSRRRAVSKGKNPRFPQKTSFPALQTESTNIVSTGSAVKNASTMLPPVNSTKTNVKRSRLPVKSALASTSLPTAAAAAQRPTQKTVKFPKIPSTESSALSTRRSTRPLRRSASQKQKTLKMTTSHGSAVHYDRLGRRVSLVANVLKTKHPYSHRVRPSSHAYVTYPNYYFRHPPSRYRFMPYEGRLSRSAIYRMRHANCFRTESASRKNHQFLNQWRPKPRLYRSRSMQSVRPSQGRATKRGKNRNGLQSFVILEQSSHLSKINEEPHKNPEEISLSMMSSEGTPVLSKKTARKIYQAKSAGMLDVSNSRNYRKQNKENLPTTSSSTKTNASLNSSPLPVRKPSNDTIVYGSDLDRYMYSINELRRIRHAKCFISEPEQRSLTKRKPLVAKVTFKPKTLYKGVIKDVKFDAADETKRIYKNLDLSPIKVPAPMTPSPAKIQPLSPVPPGLVKKRRPRVFKQRQDGALQEVTRRDYASRVSPVGTGPAAETEKQEPEKTEKSKVDNNVENTITPKRSPASSAELKLPIKDFKPDAARRVTMVGAGNSNSTEEKNSEKEQNQVAEPAAKSENLLTLPRINSNKKVARVSPEPASLQVKPADTANISESKASTPKKKDSAPNSSRKSSSRISSTRMNSSRIPKFSPERSGIPVRIKSSLITTTTTRVDPNPKGKSESAKTKIPASASGKLSKYGLNRPDVAALVTPVGAGNPNALKQVKKDKTKSATPRIKPTIMISRPSPEGARPSPAQTPKKVDEKQKLKLPQIKGRKKRMAAGADKKMDEQEWTVDIELQECADVYDGKGQRAKNDDESFVVNASVRIASASCRDEEECCIEGMRNSRTIILCSVDRPRSF